LQLLPKDVKFYDQLLEQSKLVLEAADVLRAAAQAGGTPLAEAWDRLREIEQKVDDLEHEVFRRIHKTFITPIDPEDI